MGKLESLAVTSNRGLPGRVVNPRSWLRRRPLLAFFGLAYGISWGCIALILSAIGLIMTARLEGRDGRRRLWLSVARWQIEGRWVALVLLLAVLLP